MADKSRGAGWGEGLQLWNLDLVVNHQHEGGGRNSEMEETPGGVPEEKPAPDRALESSRLSWWVKEAMES